MAVLNCNKIYDARKNINTEIEIFFPARLGFILFVGKKDDKRRGPTPSITAREVAMTSTQHIAKPQWGWHYARWRGSVNSFAANWLCPRATVRNLIYEKISQSNFMSRLISFAFVLCKSRYICWWIDE